MSKYVGAILLWTLLCGGMYVAASYYIPTVSIAGMATVYVLVIALCVLFGNKRAPHSSSSK